MQSIQAFIAPIPASLHPHHPCSLRPRSNARRLRLVSCAATSPAPDAGLIASAGVTGTCCANLWPLPILGAYGWFLNVYDRAVAARVGPFVVRAGPTQRHPLTLSFARGEAPAPDDAGASHAAFPGVAAGNLNVADNLAQLSTEPASYSLKFFEKGGTEVFWNRRNELHVEQRNDQPDDILDAWRDPAPTFQVVSRASTYEVRQLYSGVGAVPRNASKFEYFAMNLFPILPIAKYACFVCVWRQQKGATPVAIDKVHGDIRLSFFDPLELPVSNSEEMLPAIATFAVKVFFGPVTDSIVASQHKVLLAAIAASPSTRALSDTAFRVVIDNKPGVVMPNRRNELWVQVE